MKSTLWIGQRSGNKDRVAGPDSNPRLTFKKITSPAGVSVYLLGRVLGILRGLRFSVSDILVKSLSNEHCQARTLGKHSTTEPSPAHMYMCYWERMLFPGQFPTIWTSSITNELASSTKEQRGREGGPKVGRDQSGVLAFDRQEALSRCLPRAWFRPL
jgi:hypothetical protein